MSTSFAEPVLAWYARNARDLPWRAPGVTPWAVLVSEIMLQQTPVARVLPEYLSWMTRWPTPAALAAEPAGEAIRQWGRLGYPRRALRLHETATILVARHGGSVPADLDALRALPGIGSYTAAAVASFAFGQRHAVLDTNVRRVLARLAAGQPWAGGASSAASVAERRLAESLLPAEPAVAARWSVAVMELGALVCTAASPRCGDCPVARECAWLAAGRPAPAFGVTGAAGASGVTGAAAVAGSAEAGAGRRRTQKYDGTDRQCRGRLLAVLRAASDPVRRADFDAVWVGQAQLDRALDGLVADGLVDPLPDGRFALPGARRCRDEAGRRSADGQGGQSADGQGGRSADGGLGRADTGNLGGGGTRKRFRGGVRAGARRSGTTRTRSYGVDARVHVAPGASRKITRVVSARGQHQVPQLSRRP
jgi:A/G-specific adenine glycosylase